MANGRNEGDRTSEQPQTCFPSEASSRETEAGKTSQSRDPENSEQSEPIWLVPSRSRVADYHVVSSASHDPMPRLLWNRNFGQTYFVSEESTSSQVPLNPLE
jgi:hypothetical protein